jgi:cytochrome c553
MGRKIAKWSIRGFIILLVLLAIAITVTIGWRPFIGPESRQLTGRKFEPTPERLARGKYVATALSGCIYCHSPHDWKAANTPLIAGKEGSGEIMPYTDLPGQIVAPNLTPDTETGAGHWTDDQFARAIREGIAHDGRALFPMMPYQQFREMSDEDVASVIVYFRSLPAVSNALPKTDMIFPVKYLIRTAPKPLFTQVAELTTTDPVKRGEHLVHLAGCPDCHTPSDKGAPIQGMEFGGGMALMGPWGSVAAANLTPDATGIPDYDEALFLEVMRAGFTRGRKLSPIMPIMAYKDLTDDDLRAMLAYLKTMKPVKHMVDNTKPPTLCKLCRQKHGGGDQN